MPDDVEEPSPPDVGDGRPPYRLVDGEQRAWMHVEGPEGGGPGPWYTADYHQNFATLEEVMAGPPPVRPVEQISDEDAAKLRAAIELAGRKAAATIAAALYGTYRNLVAASGAQIPVRGAAGMALAERCGQQMIAGRPGSWESSRLTDLMWWGAGLKSSRVDERALQQLVALFTSWVADEHRYTEVAETLAAQVSRIADELGGWDKVADQWIRPGALDTEGVYLAHGLLYSCSDHFTLA